MRYRYITIATYMGAIVALIDQFSKWWILHSVMSPPHIVPVTSFLNFVLNWNRGVTFGLFNHAQGADWSRYFFIAVAVVILALLYNWLWRTTSMLMTLALGLVIGGAVGNIVDRIRFGAVVDFIDFHVLDYHWYVFNLADSAIVGGVGLLLLENLVTREKKG